MVGGSGKGRRRTSLLQQFDGLRSVLYGDTQHFWPYGSELRHRGQRDQQGP